MLLNHKWYSASLYSFITCIAFLNLSNVLGIDIPDRVQIADTVVKLDEKAKNNINDKINRQFGSKIVFKKILYRAKLYIPIVEEVLKKHRIPSDLKYVMILESGCNPRADGGKEDIGFWQFRPLTAKYVGLIMNDKIDERMHIEQATLGLIKYINDNHQITNNWFWAILGHNIGICGVNKYIKTNKINKKKHTISLKRCHPYMHQLIVNKLIFCEYLKRARKPRLHLKLVNENGHSVKSVCKKYKINHALFKYFNPWLKTKKIPNDTKCSVIIPLL